MSRDVAQVLSRVLHEDAQVVPAPRVGLVVRARQQARTRRRRQVVAVAAVAVVAVLVAVVPGLLPDAVGRAAPTPAGPGVLRPSLDVDGVPVTGVDIAALPDGPLPAVAWWSARTLHRSDGREVRIPDSALGAVEAPQGGALVTGGTNTAPTLQVVDSTGRALPARSATRPVVGPDGATAYVDLEQHTLVLESPDGSSSRTPLRTKDDGLAPVGFVRTGVVANAPGVNARILHAGGGVEPLRGLEQATATDPRSGVVASRSTDLRCLELRRDGDLLWRSCRNRARFTSVVAISPDGHRILLRRDSPGHPGHSQYAVAVAETGRVLRLFEAGRGSEGMGQATFENDDTVLVVSFDDAVARIVRCSLGGVCEIAGGDRGAVASGSPTPFSPVWYP